MKTRQAIIHELETYIENHLFDPMGIMYSGIDGHTGTPFDREFITPLKAPRRAAFDPWAYCSYEDSIMTSGFYLDGMTLKYELTGNEEWLKRADKVWQVVRNIYSCSQIYGIGSFIRPYGGYDQMGRFAEPLGTDQSSPLFSALYRYKKHVDDKTRTEIERMMMQWLDWYVAQGFQFFYYKSFIAKWEPKAEKTLELCASYYLPALAWAYQQTGDEKYAEPLNDGLKGLAEGRFNVAKSFIWGSDLITLSEILGDAFHDTFTEDVLKAGMDRNDHILSGYIEPGERTLQRHHPESLEPDFTPYADPAKDPGDFTKNKLGYARPAAIHAGRLWPRHEIDIYMGLAGVGYRRRELAEKALALLSERQNVPMDFTHYVPEDYDSLPESTHLFARYVGVILVQCWRNHLYLSQILKND